eukprot:CCRYP_007633-RA/>CCRYP_007633-RA protein AED:0.47 eAED:0.74 QI:0/-1/0/1/-1/1/1/0/246
MGPSQSSPSPASLCTKTLTCSSLAKANPSSSVPATLKDDTASHSPNTKDGGNRGAPPRKQDKHSDTPTAYTTSHPPNKPSDGCMRCVDTRQVHLAQGRPGRQLHRVATAHLPQRAEILPRDSGDSQRAPQPMPQERQVHQTETNSSRNLPVSPTRRRKLRDVYTHVYDTRDTIFSDQTGQFPHRSSSGNHYLMVMVDIDSSAILVEPIKNRTDLELTAPTQHSSPGFIEQALFPANTSLTMKSPLP